MSLLEQQNTLARLLTDSGFRQEFLSQPHSTGRASGLSESEIEDILKVAESDLNIFAESLVWKRLREVEKTLPITGRVAGDQFRKIFLEFAPTFNPQAIKKHYEDAVAFSRFIEERSDSGPVKDAARFERTRLTFFNESRAFAWCRLRYDLGQGSKTTQEAPQAKRPAIAVWLRIGGRVFHRVF